MQVAREFRSGALSIPTGEQRETFLENLANVRIDGQGNEELRHYLEADLDRFLYTLALIPETAAGKGLEIGANPYFMSVLMRNFRPRLEFDYVNYFEGGAERLAQQVSWLSAQGEPMEDRFEFYNINLEATPLPVETGNYDVILFCEVLEHFTMDPLHCVMELARVLKDDGVLVLTTPNVARFENVAAFIDGRNIYDPYSGYGPHGRHNREYSRHELHMLMRHAGFRCDFDFTSDVHGNIPSAVGDEAVLSVLSRIPNREHDLGQYLFSRWRKDVAVTANPKLPGWLYRSHPAEKMA